MGNLIPNTSTVFNGILMTKYKKEILGLQINLQQIWVLSQGIASASLFIHLV